jgi:hypothetical protein
MNWIQIKVLKNWQISLRAKISIGNSSTNQPSNIIALEEECDVMIQLNMHSVNL